MKIESIFFQLIAEKYHSALGPFERCSKLSAQYRQPSQFTTRGRHHCLLIIRFKSLFLLTWAAKQTFQVNVLQQIYTHFQISRMSYLPDLPKSVTDQTAKARWRNKARPVVFICTIVWLQFSDQTIYEHLGAAVCAERLQPWHARTRNRYRRTATPAMAVLTFRRLLLRSAAANVVAADAAAAAAFNAAARMRMMTMIRMFTSMTSRMMLHFGQWYNDSRRHAG